MCWPDKFDTARWNLLASNPLVSGSGLNSRIGYLNSCPFIDCQGDILYWGLASPIVLRPLYAMLLNPLCAKFLLGNINVFIFLFLHTGGERPVKLIEARWLILSWVNWVNIGSENGMSSVQHQAITWTNIVSWIPRNKYSQILMEIQTFSFKKTDLEMSSSKGWPLFCLNVLSHKLLLVSPDQLQSWYRPMAQIQRCTSPISHNASFCNRNVHMCAHFCYKIVHCGIFVWCTVGFVRWFYWPSFS